MTAAEASSPSRFAVRVAAALLVLCSAGWAQEAQKPAAEAAPAASAPASPYAGSEMCMGCHEDIYNNFFKKNRHAAIDKDKRRGWETRACESCHGPAAKHAESADPANIFNPKKGTPSQTDKTCLKCHTNQPSHVGRVMSGHGRNQVACTSCHSVHTSPAAAPRAMRINEQCATCHMDMRAQFQKPHTHFLAQKQQPNQPMACTDCHNPHGSFLSKNVSQMIGGEPGCLKCHSDKRGPFAYEHAPVRLESCSTCHEPHGSTNPRMLTRSNVTQLCLECHANLNSGAALGGIPPAFHDLRSARFRNCTICHQKIHGSHVSKALLR